jgi:hypothetical protein
MMKRLVLGALAVTLLAAPALAAVGTSKRLPGTACPAFPASNYWHADIRALPVHARSAQWIANMSPTRKLHPDFGPSYGEQSVPYGIPITYVRSDHTKRPVAFDYASESDRRGYPLGGDTKVEGGQFTSGDRHTVVVDRDTCLLYETWATRRTGASATQRWAAGSGAVWNLKSNTLRPAGWTSADAAGLPILPGLLRYDEVVSGKVDHAIRFTTDVTSRAYVWPARHQAGSTTNPAFPPMGARFRLKASFPITAYNAQTRAVLTAMKTHGLVLADNGSPWFFQGEADNRWAEALLDQLKTIPASAFEAVNTTPLMVSAGSAQVR